MREATNAQGAFESYTSNHKQALEKPQERRTLAKDPPRFADQDLGTLLAYKQLEGHRLCSPSAANPSGEVREKGNRPRSTKMLGWTILFALMSLGGIAATFAGHPASFCLKTTSFLFATLFLLSLATIAVRRQTRE